MNAQEFLKNLFQRFPEAAGACLQLYRDDFSNCTDDQYDEIIAEKLASIFPKDLIEDLDEKNSRRRGSDNSWVLD